MATRRHLIKLMAAAGLAALIPASALASPEGLIVHEWGTFNQFQGVRGMSLGLQHEEERLPDFVYKRLHTFDSPLRQFGDPSFRVMARTVNTKMETPILYVYSDTEQRLKVRVDFQGGLMTHWYPKVKKQDPRWNNVPPVAIWVRPETTSFLQWDLDVIPAHHARPAEIPHVESDDAWQFSREVEASWLRTRGRDKQADRYIFYRGLANLDLGVRVQIRSDDRVIVRNDSEHSVQGFFVVDMREDRGRFTWHPHVDARGGQMVDLRDAAWHSRDNAVEKLGEEMVDRLVEQGLYQKEAVAMVRTWKKTWFNTTGTRVLYMVPQVVTDRILPLTVDPEPDQVVRVLVGRLEYNTPRALADVHEALQDAVSDDPELATAGRERLAHYGRFLEPTLRTVIQDRAHPEAAVAAQTLLRELSRGSNGPGSDPGARPTPR